MNATKLVIGAGMLIALVGALPTVAADEEDYSMVDCARDTLGRCNPVSGETDIVAEAGGCLGKFNPTPEEDFEEECSELH